MSIKSKLLATAATLALVGGVGVGVLGTAGSAGAITPSCGPTCGTVFSQEFGNAFVLDVFQQHIKINQPIILFRASNGDPAEDFRITDQGSVAELHEAGLITSDALLLHYGCDPQTIPSSLYQAFGCPVNSNVNPGTDPFTNTCNTSLGTVGVTTVAPSVNPRGYCSSGNDEPAFEIQYTPNGVYSGYCVGVAKTAVQEEGVSLQECGASANTFWVLDTNDQPLSFWGCGHQGDNKGDNDGDGGNWNGYQNNGCFDFPLINASDTNYTQPFVLTYPDSGYPTDRPRPQLQTDNLQGYTDGEWPFFTNYGTVPDSQMWGGIGFLTYLS
jgi:hypothetical protein